MMTLVVTFQCDCSSSSIIINSSSSTSSSSIITIIGRRGGYSAAHRHGMETKGTLMTVTTYTIPWGLNPLNGIVILKAMTTVIRIDIRQCRHGISLRYERVSVSVSGGCVGGSSWSGHATTAQ